MRVYIRGMKDVDFASDAGPVKGTKIYYSRPVDGVVGEETDSIFVRGGFPLPPDLAPGKILDIFCDRKGRLELIQIVQSPPSK